MKKQIQKFENSVSLCSRKEGNYEVVLNNIEEMKKFSSVECHVVLYPFSESVSSKDFVFSPFEEYVTDILAKQRSAYAQMTDRFGNVFGLFLGVLIVIVFAAFKPSDLLSIESLVSVIASYLIGKEIWDDIENILINMTKKMPVRMVENYYRFVLEKYSTLTLYSLFAKKRRQGCETLIPERIDFIQHSNSQTLRLFFSGSDIRRIPESSAFIVGITIDPAKEKDFVQKCFLFGIKISFSRKFLFFRKSTEVFQSLDGEKQGCLDETGKWHEKAAFKRETLSFWKMKAFLSKSLLENYSLISEEK
ncbi:hypothetical protein JW890_00625 [candidate division WOR-3 bacterium]|nr:hypothetical protein [candidate division WOR-3 bacterium]